MIAYIIMGGQWGSEGKGLFAGYMAMQRQPDAVVSQFGPNAGHTWIEGNRPIVFKSLPVASIAKSVKSVFLGPGSVINPSLLRLELKELGPLLDGKVVYVHEAVAILREEDAFLERGGLTHIASTMQGTSEAMIRKIRRKEMLPARKSLEGMQLRVVGHEAYTDLMGQCRMVQVEGSQGMDLSINSGFEYPYVTSRDCTPAQILADCAIHPKDLIGIYACIRTYPIRVGNVPGGTSGPCYPDQVELSWKDIGQPEELTTVTKRVRRVFSFSDMQTERLLREVKPTGIFLNFANYIPEWKHIVKRINRLANRQIVRWTGHGARHTDIQFYSLDKLTPPAYQE